MEQQLNSTASSVERDSGDAAAPHETADSPRRLRSLDVFRGLTIAGMILVNNPGPSGRVFGVLEHASWNGLTLADLVFPFFLFILGITTHLSLSRRRELGTSDWDIGQHVLKRGAILLLIGLAGSGFPTYDPGTMKLTGVLQRIAIAYVVVAGFELWVAPRRQLAVLAMMLVGYWIAMTWIPVPGTGIPGALLLDRPAHNMAAVIDRFVLGSRMLPRQPVDPEGIFSTIPSVASVMIGALAGRLLGRRPGRAQVIVMLLAGGVLLFAGSEWAKAFPINKHLWSSSFVLVTSGMAAMLLAVCIWIVDLRRAEWWAPPFEAFGINPLVLYIGSEAVNGAMLFLTVPAGAQRVSVKQVAYASLFGWIGDPRIASLAYAIGYVLLWLAIAWLLMRKRITISV